MDSDKMITNKSWGGVMVWYGGSNQMITNISWGGGMV